MIRNRRCKMCREKFDFDKVQASEPNIAKYLLEGKIMGVITPDATLCRACLEKMFDTNGIEGIPKEEMEICKWYDDTNTLRVVTWHRVLKDRLYVVRCITSHEVFEGRLRLERMPVSAESLNLSEEEAHALGYEDVDPASFQLPGQEA